jgi:UDP-glucose 4-epimerase
MVKRVSGIDFKVEVAPRCLIVAASDRTRIKLGWNPQDDNLAASIAHALAWEKSLRRHALID